MIYFKVKKFVGSLLIIYSFLSCSNIFCQERVAINKDVISSISIKDKIFIIELKNNTDQSIYLLKYNNYFWCYNVEVWDDSKVGYSINTKRQFAASENGAFLDTGKFGFHEVEPNEKIIFKFPFLDMAADPSIMQKVEKMLIMDRASPVFVRPDVTIMIEPNFGSERVTVIGEFVQASPAK